MNQVASLKISSFPYIIFNYAVVATDVNYGPYIFGSLVGTVPEVFLTIYRFRIFPPSFQMLYIKSL